MENYVTIDRARRRVVIRAEGQWILSQAMQYHRDMQAVLDWSRATPGPISIFADLNGLILHTAQVSRQVEASVELMRLFPIDRYALIVPSALMRMQVRRLLAGIPHRHFDDEPTALAWLGWTDMAEAAA